MTRLVTHDSIECAYLRFSIEVPIDAFTALLDSESHVTGHACYHDGNSPLNEKLEMGANVFNVEYDGHFGNYIWYSVEYAVHSPEVTARVLSIINDHLDWALSVGSKAA